MREILFRGKRIDNGKWIVGDGLFQFEIHPSLRRRTSQIWVDGKGWVYVDPETVDVSVKENDDAKIHR